VCSEAVKCRKRERERERVGEWNVRVVSRAATASLELRLQSAGKL
jgi:hypothetical protein